MRNYYVPEKTIAVIRDMNIKIIFPQDKREFPNAPYDYILDRAGRAFEPDGSRADDHNSDLEKELRACAESFFPKFKFDFMADSRVEILSNKDQTIATIKIEAGNPELRIFGPDGLQTQRFGFSLPWTIIKCVETENDCAGIFDPEDNELAGYICIRNKELTFDFPCKKIFNSIALPIDDRVKMLFPPKEGLIEA